MTNAPYWVGWVREEEEGIRATIQESVPIFQEQKRGGLRSGMKHREGKQKTWWQKNQWLGRVWQKSLGASQGKSKCPRGQVALWGRADSRDGEILSGCGQVWGPCISGTLAWSERSALGAEKRREEEKGPGMEGRGASREPGADPASGTGRCEHRLP